MFLQAETHDTSPQQFRAHINTMSTHASNQSNVFVILFLFVFVCFVLGQTDDKVEHM